MKNIKDNAFNVELAWVNSKVCDALVFLVTPSPVLFLQTLDDSRIFQVFFFVVFFMSFLNWTSDLL